jgi:undecaprenyl-diphosphatase
MVVIAFLPLAVLGMLFGNMLKEYLFAPMPVALAFIIGGIIILIVERRAAANPVAVRGACDRRHDADGRA